MPPALRNPRYLLYGLLFLVAVGVLVWSLVLRDDEQVAIDAPPGYRLVDVEELSAIEPSMYWLGEEIEGQGILLAAVAVGEEAENAERSGQNFAEDAKATVYYGAGQDDIRNLAIFLRSGKSAEFIESAVSDCRQGECPENFEGQELDSGFAVVNEFPTGGFEAYVLIGESPLYVTSDLSGVTAEEALAQLEPVPSS